MGTYETVRTFPFRRAPGARKERRAASREMAAAQSAAKYRRPRPIGRGRSYVGL